MPVPHFQENETNNANHPNALPLTHMRKFEPICPAILLVQPRSIRKSARLAALAFWTRWTVEIRNMLISNITEPVLINICAQGKEGMEGPHQCILSRSSNKPKAIL